MKKLVIQDVYKSFGEVEVIRGFNLEVEEGEFVSLLGPSGCGKTTMLRMIAGLTLPTSGTIIINGQDVSKLPAYKRSNGMVFQNYALFPHMTVDQNVAFGLKMHKTNKAVIKDRVAEALDMVRLSGLGKRYPKELSGGQQQRVALARALVLHPTLLLLDEPLSNLDAQLRKEMRTEIRQIQKKLNVATIFVTHDQEEALTMSDRIAVINRGVLEQLGSPVELYDQPATQFVASFIGSTNILSGEVTACEGDKLIVKLGDTAVALENTREGRKGQMVTFSIRPERLQVSETPQKSPDENAVECKILHRIYLGGSIRYITHIPAVGEAVVEVQATSKFSALRPDETVYIKWAVEDARVVAAE